MKTTFHVFRVTFILRHFILYQAFICFNVIISSFSKQSYFPQIYFQIIPHVSVMSYIEKKEKVHQTNKSHEIKFIGNKFKGFEKGSSSMFDGKKESIFVIQQANKNVTFFSFRFFIQISFNGPFF
jgi:hypothetical protein